MHDVTLDQLRSASERLGQTPTHPVLGFYAGTIGYAIPTTRLPLGALNGGSQCSDARVEVDLLVVDRRIAIASELTEEPCLYKAALDHYRRHAEAASAALRQFALTVQGKFQSDFGADGASTKDDFDALRRGVAGEVDAALQEFDVSLRRLQRALDADRDAQRLSAPCEPT